MTTTRESGRRHRWIYKYEFPKLHHDGLHRALWRASDRRHRVVLNIAEIAERYDVSYDITNDAVIAMREAGRMRAVGHHKGPTKIYELADPDLWRPEDPSTHARRQPRPTWG